MAPGLGSGKGKRTSSRRIAEAGGIQNNNTGEVPESEKARTKKSGGGGGGGRYLDVASGKVSSEPPKVSYVRPDLTDDAGEPISDEAAERLGVIEKAPKDKRSVENGFREDGPMPLWMERQRQQGGGPAPRTRGSSAPPPQQPAVVASGPPISQGGVSDVTLINHTDVSLKLVATDAAGTGQKVERTLRPKDADAFMAPYGSILNVINPKTNKSLMKYTVSTANTTLAVTAAALLQSGDVGSSGRWFDSRANCIFFGAAIVLGVVGIAAAIYILFNYFLAKKLQTAAPR